LRVKILHSDAGPNGSGRERRIAKPKGGKNKKSCDLGKEGRRGESVGYKTRDEPGGRGVPKMRHRVHRVWKRTMDRSGVAVKRAPEGLAWKQRKKKGEYKKEILLQRDLYL